jgi:hypothetical protein
MKSGRGWGCGAGRRRSSGSSTIQTPLLEIGECGVRIADWGLGRTWPVTPAPFSPSERHDAMQVAYIKNCTPRQAPRGANEGNADCEFRIAGMGDVFDSFDFYAFVPSDALPGQFQSPYRHSPRPPIPRLFACPHRQASPTRRPSGRPGPRAPLSARVRAPASLPGRSA